MLGDESGSGWKKKQSEKMALLDVTFDALVVLGLSALVMRSMNDEF